MRMVKIYLISLSKHHNRVLDVDRVLLQLILFFASVHQAAISNTIMAISMSFSDMTLQFTIITNNLKSIYYSDPKGKILFNSYDFANL